MARSLNRVQLIGNLTRDPELRYTPKGTAVCTFGIATNRRWKTDSGDFKEETEFHRIVAWNRLAELCSQLLTKGRRAYVEGRLSTRSWTGQDGAQRVTTETVIDDMILLDRREQKEEVLEEELVEESTPSPSDLQPEEATPTTSTKVSQTDKSKKSDKKEKGKEALEKSEEDVNPEDIPF